MPRWSKMAAAHKNSPRHFGDHPVSSEAEFRRKAAPPREEMRISNGFANCSSPMRPLRQVDDPSIQLQNSLLDLGFDGQVSKLKSPGFARFWNSQNSVNDLFLDPFVSIFGLRQNKLTEEYWQKNEGRRIISAELRIRKHRHSPAFILLPSAISGSKTAADLKLTSLPKGGEKSSISFKPSDEPNKPIIKGSSAHGRSS